MMLEMYIRMLPREHNITSIYVSQKKLIIQWQQRVHMPKYYGYVYQWLGFSTDQHISQYWCPSAQVRETTIW